MKTKHRNYLIKILLVASLLIFSNLAIADKPQVNINGMWLTDDMLEAVEDELGAELEAGYYLFDYINGLRPVSEAVNDYATQMMESYIVPNQPYGYDGGQYNSYDYGQYSQQYPQDNGYYGNQGGGQPYYDANQFGYTGSDGDCSYVYIPGSGSVMTGGC